MQTKKILSKYTGSKLTYELIKREIEQRFGKEEADKYDPYRNTLTYRNWVNLGYKIKPGEHALKSKILVESVDKETNKPVKYFKTINLFYYLQVEKINNN